MKKISLKFHVTLLAGCVIMLGACNSEKLCSEAIITGPFTVKSTSDMVFRAIIDNNAVTIKVSPVFDAATELNDAIPNFYLSKGATVSPDPSAPQNFAQAGGVKYTVTAEDGKTKNEYTVTWESSDPLPYGAGFSYAAAGAAKSFVELGYPGEVGNTGLQSIEYGDLQMYHAYCGDYIVLLSRAYINVDPLSTHCVKVVDKTNLNDAGKLNLGSITLPSLRMITSDYKGRCVAAVVVNNETEFFYWTTPTAAPVSVGKISVNMASTQSSIDPSANFQVAGDITGNAWITALAPRSSQGEHYRIKVTGGRLASDYSIVETGYPSNDFSKFQMISPLDDSDSPNFVIGDSDTPFNPPHTTNSTKCYINTFSGLTTYMIPHFWNSILQAWWVNTGFSTLREGGRSPIVTALPINGKTYITVTTGTNWWFAAAVLSDDLQSLAHENLNIAFDIASSRGWSFGEWVDWYYNEEDSEAYLAVWFGRLGLYTYKMMCFE